MHIDQVRRVLIIGAGTVGPQVAVQCAVFGYEVVLHDIDPARLAAALDEQKRALAEHVARGALPAADAEATLARITAAADPAQAAREVDLVSESVTENLQLKRQVLSRFSKLCPERAVFTTNSSYFLPSMLARSLARPERFASLHFHVPVWLANVVDIMPHPGTDPQAVALLETFARRIGQVPIVSRRESHGYVFNAMLRQLLMSAMTLAETGVASEEDVDRAWMGVTKMPIGPFGLIDNIGLETVYDIAAFWGNVLGDTQATKNAAYLKRRIDAGLLGIKSGRGFYSYPQPAYASQSFLLGGAEQRAAGSRQQAETPVVAESTPAVEPAPGEQQRRQRVAERFVLRAVAAAPLPSAVPDLSGGVLIVGQSAEAGALQLKLRSLGARAEMLPLAGSLEETLAQVDRLLVQQPPAHLFLLTAREPAAATRWEAEQWAPRQAQGLLLPYFVCQKWFAAAVSGRLRAPSLVVATALGGDFGLSLPPAAVEGGAVTGLAKAVFMEAVALGLGQLAVRAVDLPDRHDPAGVADLLLAELADAQRSAASAPVPSPAALAAGALDVQPIFARFAQLEVGYAGGRRVHLRLQRAPLPDAAPSHLGSGAWVVTGGARGITAVVARELGRRYGLKLHLVGTTPLPQTDYTTLSPADLAQLRSDVMKQAYASGEKPNVAWSRIEKAIEVQRTLAAIRGDGIHAAYHACNLGDRGDVERMLRDVRDASGPIEGVVHGAGVEVTGRFVQKQLDVVQATLAPKYLGTAALMELTQDDPLRWFIAFGSAVGRFGGVGQTDYALANDLLAKQVAWFRRQRPDCRAALFHWPGWDQVGMAARPASRFSLSRIDHALLPPEEGVAHLLAELAGGCDQAEVLLVDPREIPTLLQAP